MALTIRCDKHKGYNGVKVPWEHCESCWQLYAIKRQANAFPDLRVVLPLKLVTEPYLGLATTGALLDELKARTMVDGSINYKTHGGGE